MNGYVKSILAGAIAGGALITADYAYAGGGEVISVIDRYKTVTTSVPHTERVCNTVDVPIYGAETFDQGDAIVGGIVGGLLGSQIGKGSGNKVATGVGAVAGAIIGGKKDANVVGYRREEQCRNHTEYTTESKEVYSHSIVKFRDDKGKVYSVRFQK